MEDQSPYVSSSKSGSTAHDTEEKLHRGPEQPQPSGRHWEDLDDVLDLTGGAGQMAHPNFSVAFSTKPVPEEEEEDRRSYSDSLEPSPEDEEPSSIGSEVPRAPVIPSAPEEEPVKPAAPYSAPSSGSVDMNLFPLPAASAPLHSSADDIMDFKQPSCTLPVVQEELSSLLFESTTSLPLSDLSADYSKKPTATSVFPAASGALQDAIGDVFTGSRTIDGFTLAEKLGTAFETDYSEITGHAPPSALKDIKDELIFSERGHVVEQPTSQPESVSGDYSKVYSQSAKEMFSGMLKSVGPPHEEFSDLKEGLDEHYIDFKPFVNTAAHEFERGAKDLFSDLKSDIGSLSFETTTKPEGKYSEEKEIDLSDDISPVTPEPMSESPNYEMFTQSGKTGPLTFGGSSLSGNKTDEEKKIEEMEFRTVSSHYGSNVATVNPFLEHMHPERDYVTTDRSSESFAAQVANKTDGLTPDIVQEAYESEVYEIGIPKLSYEPKIDLVQTSSKAPQDNVSTTQNTALFEDSESVSSPVLPDIVMEAPLSSTLVGLESMAPQPDVSPVRHVTLINEEKIKFESEKPPSYEEATNKESVLAQEPVTIHKKPVKVAPAEEPETPYISIACDLIKETIAEQSATDFPKAPKNELDFQFTPHYDESSPESESSEPSYKLWQAEVISKDAPTALVDSAKSQTISAEKDRAPVWDDLSPSKTYLESFQTKSYISEDNENILAGKPRRGLSDNEKPLQMEELGKAVYSEEFSLVKQPARSEKSPTFPSINEFGMKATGKDQLVFQDTKEKQSNVKEQLKEDEVYWPDKPKESWKSSDKRVDFSKAEQADIVDEETALKPQPPPRDADTSAPSKEKKEPKEPSTPALASDRFKTSVVDLLYWRDIKKSGAVFGVSLFLLLSLTVFSIVSVTAYIALALLSVSISFRIYKGVLQAIQKSDEGHPFKSFLESDVAVSEDLVQKYCNVVLGHINKTNKELRRLFLVDDLVDSLKFAVLMWVFTYIGALFNGLTLLILALISLFSIPVIYERHQAQIDHYLGLINKNFKSTTDLILAKIPGLKRKAE